jgi:hypothetical protein
MNTIKKMIISLVILLTIIALFNLEKIYRLHAIITLFDQEKIVSNFSNMEQATLSLPILKTGKTYQFTQASKDLPGNFTYRNEAVVVNDFLKRRATTALMVIKNDEVTFEDYYLGTESGDKRISWSMAKSFVSVLFGMQVDAGKIDIEKPVSFYLPEMKGSG